MSGARARRVAAARDPSMELFTAIGNFLAEHRLSPDPRHYEFAFRVLSDAEGPLARAVAELTDGGYRLTGRNIEELGGEVATSASPAATRIRADTLVAETQHQVEGFSDIMQAMARETQDFGRDLARSADAIRLDRSLGLDEVLRVTGSMLDRVRSAEQQLDVATREASELRQKLEEARESARTDPLTGLPNRRAFEEAYAKAERKGDPLCLAVVDIDHFKSVNDRFGHAVGDRVLKAIAEALQRHCPGAIVARYGGEEFALLFQNLTLAATRATLEEAREAVAARRFRLRETDEPLGAVTFSCGITRSDFSEGLGVVFGRADRFLYAAKEAGRNRVQQG
ncbi:GGDEF domain-containing protein [Sphingomonas aracearum]|uniref:diguanylate cyclase n=1 Tax=Sphingomonas aracearum TaxID=2283317 RepID=A0A369VUD4_9SPHN|nr:GGDEF domain-containing protein [Sphingomonas aracearum]RDE05986.1 GGDEF domain-containing protein [Sphingomonas aracearum]